MGLEGSGMLLEGILQVRSLGYPLAIDMVVGIISRTTAMLNLVSIMCIGANKALDRGYILYSYIEQISKPGEGIPK